MKLFISYCEKDNEGLPYARRAKAICEDRDIEAWVWHDDSSSAEWLKTDIANNIDSCSAMLTLVTTGTANSEAQKEEWSLAGSFNKINVSIRKKGLSPTPELRARYSPEFNDSDFERICNKAIDDIIGYLGTEKREGAKETRITEYQLYDISKKLDGKQEDLRKETIEEFQKSVWEGYLGSNIVRNVASLVEAKDTDKNKLINIVILRTSGVEEINAENYIWGPAFKQVGAAIARGEEGFLIKRIEEEVGEIKESCNETKDELSIIEKEIKRLGENGHVPNIILAPASMFKSFVHFFKEDKGNINFTGEHGSAAVLEIGKDTKLGIYLLSGDILSTHVIIYDKSSIRWKVLLNPDTDFTLTTGIGKRFYPDRVGFIAGTTVTCTVENKQGITRIPIVR